MIRNLMVFTVLVFAGFFIALHLAYHSMDPCRALAVEQARRSPVATGIAHIWTRAETAHRGPAACTRALIGSWRDRLQS